MHDYALEERGFANLHNLSSHVHFAFCEYATCWRHMYYAIVSCERHFCICMAFLRDMLPLGDGPTHHILVVHLTTQCHIRFFVSFCGSKGVGLPHFGFGYTPLFMSSRSKLLSFLSECKRSKCPISSFTKEHIQLFDWANI